jgi:Protein of unknown function (DUF2630)
MTDEDILGRIKSLLDEEHAMREANEVDPVRLAHLEETLDQCWDLLRQRRALREFGQDESHASSRTVETVEEYLQ